MAAKQIGEHVLPAVLAAHAGAVDAHLRGCVMQAQGFLPFDAFMHEALYAPGLGYYVAGLAKIGGGGDFITAPEISPLYGRVIARTIVPVLAELGSNSVVEYGPGTGALAEAIIDWFAEQGRSLDYCLVEVSPDLAACQRERLNQRTRPSNIRWHWVDDPAALLVRGVILANEVADALPVRRFRLSGNSVLEVGVSIRDGALALVEQPARAAVAAAVAALQRRRGAPWPDGFQSEYAPGLAPWVGALASNLDAGLILIADYGAGAPDYYGAERSSGTFRCHFRHRAYDDALLAPGLTDMTAWVDFTALAEAALAAGLGLAGFTTQSGFLIDGGVIDEATGRYDPASQPAVAAALRTLTMPGEMGERFRLMGLERGTLPPVAGFGFRDLTHTL